MASATWPVTIARARNRPISEKEIREGDNASQKAGNSAMAAAKAMMPFSTSFSITSCSRRSILRKRGRAGFTPRSSQIGPAFLENRPDHFAQQRLRQAQFSWGRLNLRAPAQGQRQIDEPHGQQGLVILVVAVRAWRVIRCRSDVQVTGQVFHESLLSCAS